MRVRDGLPGSNMPARRVQVAAVVLAMLLVLLQLMATRAAPPSQTVPTPTPVPPPPTPTPPPPPALPAPTPTPTPLPPLPPTEPPGVTPTPTPEQPATPVPSPPPETPAGSPIPPPPSPTPTPVPPATPSTPVPTPQPVTVDVGVTPRAASWMLAPGEQVTVTAILENRGDPLVGVLLALQVPAEVTLLEANVPDTWQPYTAPGSWWVERWPEGEQATITLVLQAATDAPLGLVTDVWLYWRVGDTQGQGLVATLAFPPDHLPAVGEKVPQEGR